MSKEMSSRSVNLEFLSGLANDLQRIGTFCARGMKQLTPELTPELTHGTLQPRMVKEVVKKTRMRKAMQRINASKNCCCCIATLPLLPAFIIVADPANPSQI